MALEDFQLYLSASYENAVTGQPLEREAASDYASRLRGLSAALSLDLPTMHAAELRDLADSLAKQTALDETWTIKRRGDAATALRRFAEFKAGGHPRIIGYKPLSPGAFTVAVTDLGWHAQLLDAPAPSLVNFWTPTLWKPRFGAGGRFFFMLKAPVRRIGGFGIVSGYEELEPAEAWRRWGNGNGVSSAEELEARVTAFAAKRSVDARPKGSPIGCIILRDCIFLDGADQLTATELGFEFPVEIVKYKRFPGALTLPIEGERRPGASFSLVDGAPDRASATGSRKLRAQQALFRANVLAAYGGRCAFTGTCDRDVIDAAHIQPYVSPESNHVQNGLALRKDMHALFDAGLLALSDELEILVSTLLQDKAYQDLAGRKMRLPGEPGANPSIDAIRFQHRAFRP